jgi:hypothetical protein
VICKPCAWEADGNAFGTRCRVCLREIAVYCTSPAYPSYNLILVHGAFGMKRCPGSKEQAIVTGHAACTGCDCAHLPVGTGREERRHG